MSYNFEFANIDDQKIEAYRKSFFSKKPFKYLVADNFLHNDKAELLYNSYPKITEGTWDGKTYIHSKNKFAKTKFEEGSPFKRYFDEINSTEFCQVIAQITGIKNIVGDDDLFGGGLHQSLAGAFLDVHVDFNIHPKTSYHRRLNILIYMNKDWKDEYEGHLELWDMQKKECIDVVAPIFNRCVIFETNEISFHGHPKPLKTPDGVNRKSLAGYYYTKERPAEEIASDHSTIYVNTEGLTGLRKSFFSGVRAFFERLGGDRN